MKIMTQFIFIISLFFSSVLPGQAEIDSLENLVKEHAEADTFRINLLNKTADKLQNIDIEKLMLYAQEAESLSVRLDYNKGKSQSRRLIGVYYLTKSNYIKSMEYHQNALNYAEKMNYKIEITNIYNNIGIIHYYQKDYAKALEYYQKALEIALEIQDFTAIPRGYNNIGEIYSLLGDYQKAEENFYKALTFTTQSGDKGRSAWSYHNIGNIYAKLGNYSEAEEFYTKSLNIGLEIESIPLEAVNFLGIGALYLKQKMTMDAVNFSKRAYELAEQTGQIELLTNSSEILAKSSAAAGMYKDAYKYHVIFRTLSDSNRNEETTDKIKSLEYEYNYQKELEIAEQEKQNNVRAEELVRQHLIRNILIIAVLIILLTGTVLFQMNSSKQKTNFRLLEACKKINTQQIALRNINADQERLLITFKETNASKDKFFSIIAHDIKNPLQTLLSGSRLLSQRIDQFDEKTIKEIAAGMRLKTENLFELLENLLQWARVQMGKISVEPAKLNLFYLTQKWINALNDNAKQKKIILQNNIDQSLTVYADNMMTESVIQNLLANAIKFTEKGGKIELNAEMNDDAIQITIKDDGVGIAKERIDKLFNLEENMTTRGTADEKGTGLGLILCREFVEKNTGKIWIESKENSGTSVHFTLPAAQNKNSI